MIHPSALLAAIQSPRNGSPEGEAHVLSDVEIGAGLAHLDGAVANRIGNLKRRHDFSRPEDLKFKFAVGHIDTASDRNVQARTTSQATSGSSSAAASSQSATTGQWRGWRWRLPRPDGGTLQKRAPLQG